MTGGVPPVMLHLSGIAGKIVRCSPGHTGACSYGCQGLSPARGPGYLKTLLDWCVADWICGRDVVTRGGAGTAAQISSVSSARRARLVLVLHDKAPPAGHTAS